jgi:transposase-like protein
MNRPPHKRGGSIRTRGLSEEQVCIPCAVSRGGVAYAKVSNLGSISTEELVRFYTGKFADDATFVTDSLRAYKRAAKELNVPLIQVKGGKAKKGIYNIQSVNAYHSQLKAFLRGFNGVSTKYLNNYLALSNYANYENYASSEQRDSLLKDILAAYRTIKCRTIRKRPAIPVIC